MHDLDSALDDIVRVRSQLAASTRFRGFAPRLVAVTGLMALALASWQSFADKDNLIVWILLAVICALMIGTEAVVRARRVHRTMADRLISITLIRFLPCAATGAIAGLVLLMFGTAEQARLLPGIWQLQMGAGIFAALANLPSQMRLAGFYYFGAGVVSLILGAASEVALAWLMGVPFFIGQLLVAATLYMAAAEDRDVG